MTMAKIEEIIRALRCISTFSGVCDTTCIYHKQIDVALGECECTKVVRDAADALERMTATDSIGDGRRILMIMGTDCGYDGMNWMDKHGFRECYDYVGGFADRFSWIRIGLEKLNHSRLMELFNHFVMEEGGKQNEAD